MARETGLRIVMVGAAAALTLAAAHFLFHWVLFTETLTRRILY